nr:immunoglobulin heavy chain junction region [Mus musculus]MBK4188189.1 immunoglobulin heavy chain junction region [Mus musculus]MBK4188190.1 immunoglobulin heavy chain junction region [Mus musculus]MBK4188192.1 immunoglobulin heavy chain junction region [Mus musculus]
CARGGRSFYYGYSYWYFDVW